MSASAASIGVLHLGGSFEIGASPDARVISETNERALIDFRRHRALPPALSALSTAAQVAVSTHWTEPCEAMFEFLSDHFEADLLALVSSRKLSAPDMTFAAEMAGRAGDSRAVREVLLPLLDHESSLVREGAIYGLREHADGNVVTRLSALSQDDASPAIRRAASDTLADL